MFIDNYEYERIKEQLEGLTIYTKEAFIERLVDEYAEKQTENYVDIGVYQEQQLIADEYQQSLTEISELCEQLDEALQKSKTKTEVLNVVHRYLKQIYELSLER